MRNNPMLYLVLTVLILAIDFYSFQGVRAVTRDMNPVARRNWEIVFWAVTGISLLSIYATLLISVGSWPNAVRSYLFATILLIYLGKLFLVVFLMIDDVFRLFRWLVGLIPTKQTSEGPRDIGRLKFISQIGMGLASFTVFAGMYGMIVNAYNYKIHRIKITLPNLPDAFVGLKIVQLSDIHSGSFTRSEPLEHAVETVNKENADLIFFTGDLVNNRATEIEQYLHIFGKMKAKEGIYSTFGNHDYGDYDGDMRNDKTKWLKNRADLMGHHATMGWDLLMDEHRILRRGDDHIAIIGIQNSSGTRNFKTYGDLPKAYKGAENAPVKLLLSHDPSYWDACINSDFKDIDVTFAGHTHGAQFGIEIPGFRWSPSQYIYKQWAGLYQTGKQYLYVNRGFGFLGYPGRIGILPEITVFELVKA